MDKEENDRQVLYHWVITNPSPRKGNEMEERGAEIWGKYENTSVKFWWNIFRA